MTVLHFFVALFMAWITGYTIAEFIKPFRPESSKEMMIRRIDEMKNEIDRLAEK